MSFISGRTTDGVISEPIRGSNVATVFPNMPPIKSYLEAAADYFVVKPSSSFVLAPSDQYVKWNTTWGAAPSSCSLRSTMGNLAKLYGFDDNTSWSPSCWNLECPAPGDGAGSVAAPFQPTQTQFQSYDPMMPTYENTGRCLSACAALCSGPGDTTKCATACADRCLNPLGFGVGSPFHDTRTCTSYCAEKCAGDPNYASCTAKCTDECWSANPRSVEFAIAGDLNPDICANTCTQRCSSSSNVNDCFAPCVSKCPTDKWHRK